MSGFRVLVDADSCHKKVRSFLLSKSEKMGFPLVFAANKIIPSKNPPPKNFLMQICPKEKDAADKWILQNAREGDVVVTRDILLAELLLQKNVCAINDRGFLFSRENIGRKLKERKLDMQMQELGIGTERRSSYSKKEFLEFEKRFFLCREDLE